MTETEPAPRDKPIAMSPARARSLHLVLRILSALALVGACVGAVSARVIWAGESEISASTQALRNADLHEATTRARRAAGWYAPGAPHVRVAYERLIVIATVAEGHGDRDLALLAWRAVRTAAIETRWIVTPHEIDLERANKAIARIESAAARPPGTRVEPPQRIEQRQLDALVRDEAPHVPWVVAFVTAFFAWAGGAAWGVRQGKLAPEGRAFAHARPGFVVALFGIALWVLALFRA